MNRPFYSTVISVDELWSLFNLSDSFFCIAGTDGYLRHINPAFTQLLGFPEEEFVSIPVIDFIHPDDKSMVTEKLGQLEHAKTVSFSCRFITSGGSYKWLLWSATHPHKGGLIYAVAQDDTDRHEMRLNLIDEATNGK